MIKFGLLLVLFFTGILISYSQTDLNQLKQESIQFNKKVTDAEIVDFLNFQYKIDPKLLQEFKAVTQDSIKRKEFLLNYRNSHNNAGIKLPTLKGMTPKEIAQLEEIFKFKKKEYYESLNAAERMESYSKDQLKLVFNEALKLINDPEIEQKQLQGVVNIKDIPKKLAFLKPHSLSISNGSLRLSLQKGIGKGIGFIVKKEDDEWRLFSYNQYETWQLKTIEF